MYKVFDPNVTYFLNHERDFFVVHTHFEILNCCTTFIQRCQQWKTVRLNTIFYVGCNKCGLKIKTVINIVNNIIVFTTAAAEHNLFFFFLVLNTRISTYLSGYLVIISHFPHKHNIISIIIVAESVTSFDELLLLNVFLNVSPCPKKVRICLECFETIVRYDLIISIGA